MRRGKRIGAGVPTIQLREGIEYHDVADTINGQFRTCTLGCGDESERLTREDLDQHSRIKVADPQLGPPSAKAFKRS